MPSALFALALSGAALAGEPETFESAAPSVGAAAPTVSAIINGEDATIDDYPMTGGMMMDADLNFQGNKYDIRMFVCSSTLIAPDVVLLAAHCLDDYAFTYGFGTIENKDIRWTRQADLSAHDGSAVNEWPTDAIVAWDWVVHEEFDLQKLQTGIATNYDIALIFLDQAVTDVPYAYVITEEEAAQLAVGTEVAVVGWGQQVASDSPFDAPEPGTYAYKQQGMSSIAELGEAEFQVGLLETDVRKCHGDSGGPSFAWVETDLKESMRIVGVTSHAYDQTDCKETGGVDTRVDFYLGWIDAEMRARCEDGTRVWCDEPGLIPVPAKEPVDDGGEDVEEEEDEKGGLRTCSSGAAPTPGGLGLLAALGLAGLMVRRRR
ncbi:trypsin-like serine protease [Myxococcota bacterium]|nr:trypsin-like serine protease [Myxococcota bacterium]